jgi:predicted acyl esterase
MVRSSAARRCASGNKWLRRGGVVLAASLFAVLAGVAATAATAPAPAPAHPGGGTGTPGDAAYGGSSDDPNSSVRASEGTVRADNPPSTYPGGGTWSPGDAKYGGSSDVNISVRVSDGTILKVDVTYPTDLTTGQRLPGPFPVVLNQDPYTGGATTLASQGGERPVTYFTQHGYIYVHLHQRGTAGPGPNGSQGAQDLSFGPRMGLDGVEVAYWAADPVNVPGTNGKIGLQGCSALGVIQLSTLAALGELEGKEAPTVYVPGKNADLPGHTVAMDVKNVPIKAALPACFTHSEYLTQFTDNGVPTLQDAMAFVAPVAGLAIFGTDPANASSSLGPTFWSTDMLTSGDLGYNRDFWLRRDWLRRADDIGRTGVPTLMQVGFQESGFMSAQPLYAALQNYAAGKRGLAMAGPMDPNQKPDPRYMAIIGNWGHGGGIDKGIELEWLDTWVRGDQTTKLHKARGSLMIQEIAGDGTVRWISSPTFPISTRYKALYLHSGGTLSETQPAAADPADQIVWPAGSAATYKLTADATQDMNLLAPTTAELWVQSSSTNAQLYVELQDVAPDGTVTTITHGSLFASRRQTDPGRSWTAPNGFPMQPYLNLNADVFPAANTAVKLDVPLQPVSWRVLKGHSLQLSVAPAAGSKCAPTQNPLASPVPTGCMYPAAVAQSLAGGVFQILHDSTHPSVLNAALVSDSEVPWATDVRPTPTSGTVTYPHSW